MDILVLGGDGFIGRHLCAELDERGHDVTELSRTADPDVLPDEVDTIRGNVIDYESIAPAFEGRDAVVNLVALSPMTRPKGGEQRHLEVHLGGTKNVLRAAEEHGVARVLQQSALGADPNGPTHYLRAKGRAEAVTRDSDCRWVITRPSIVFGEAGHFLPYTKKVTTPYVTGLPGGGELPRYQPIWVGDLTPVLADAVEGTSRGDQKPEASDDAVEEDRHIGETYKLAGPEVLTMADVTRLIYRGEGKSVTIVPVPMALAKAGLTVTDEIPGAPVGKDQYRSLKFDNTTDQNAIDALGMSEEELTIVPEYLQLE